MELLVFGVSFLGSNEPYLNSQPVRVCELSTLAVVGIVQYDSMVYPAFAQSPFILLFGLGADI